MVQKICCLLEIKIPSGENIGPSLRVIDKNLGGGGGALKRLHGLNKVKALFQIQHKKFNLSTTLT